MQFSILHLILNFSDVTLEPPINAVWKISHRYSWYKQLSPMGFNFTVELVYIAIVHSSKFTGFLESFWKIISTGININFIVYLLLIPYQRIHSWWEWIQTYQHAYCGFERSSCWPPKWSDVRALPLLNCILYHVAIDKQITWATHVLQTQCTITMN